MSTIKSSGENLKLSSDNTKDIELQHNGSTKVTVKSDGNVGIGTTSPTATTHVKSSGISGFDSTQSLRVEGYGTGNNGDAAILSFAAGDAKAKGAIAFTRNSSYGRGYLGFYIDNAGDSSNVSSTDEVMRISSTGIVTTPYQPAFRVQHNYSNNTELTASSPNFTLDPLNTGNHFSLSTNRFTAPVTGNYYFSYESLVDANDTTSYAVFDMLVNGSRVALSHSDSSNHGTYYPLSVSCVAHLNATDYVTLLVTTNDGGLYSTNNYSNFSGYLIG